MESHAFVKEPVRIKVHLVDLHPNDVALWTLVACLMQWTMMLQSRSQRLRLTWLEASSSVADGGVPGSVWAGGFGAIVASDSSRLVVT